MLSYDIFEKLSDDSIYSIDNLRLQFNIKEDKYDYYVSSLQPYVEDTESDFFDCRYYHTTKIFSFEHLYSFKSKDKKQSFTIAFSRPGAHKFAFDGFLDFNPNKVADWNFFLLFYKSFLSYACDVSIRRYDLAIDLPVERNVVKLIKDRRSYHYLKDRSVTEYLGKRSNHNFLKVYDKQHESNLDYPLTRIEITADIDQNIVFPDIRLKKLTSGISVSDLNVTDAVLFELLQQVEDPFQYVQKLAPRKRAQFKELLKSDYEDFKYDPLITIKLLDRVKDKYLEGNMEFPDELEVSFIKDVELPWEV